MNIILQPNQIQLLFMIGVMSIVLFFVILCRYWFDNKKMIKKNNKKMIKKDNKKRKKKDNKNNKK